MQVVNHGLALVFAATCRRGEELLLPNATIAVASEPAARAGDLGTTAYRRIRDAVLKMELHPGQRLQEVVIAAWLGISRTPVREAFRRLQAEGLLRSLATRGVVVAEVSIDEVDDAYRVIEMLEALSSRLAAERLTVDGATAIRALLGQMQEAAAATELERWAKLDADLHTTIRALANNPKLVQIADLVYPVIERVRHLHLREGFEPAALAAETVAHRRLGEAILAHAGEQAEALVRALFAKARQDNVRLLRRWVAPLRRSFCAARLTANRTRMLADENRKEGRPICIVDR
jgi:DNA-binding GntR family transcriptional regulator